MPLEARKRKKKVCCGAIGKLVNSKEPSDQVKKSYGCSKTENEIFVIKNPVWGPEQDQSLER